MVGMSFHLFPVGLTYLWDEGIDVVDCVLERWTPQSPDLFEYVLQRQPDVVGVSWWSQNTPAVLETLAMLKLAAPQALLVVGGPHPTNYRERIFAQAPMVDVAFTGEADRTWRDWLAVWDDRSQWTTCTGLICRHPPFGWYHGGQDFPQDLDGIRPRYDQWQLARYHPAGYAYGNWGEPDAVVAPIVATRGCPYACQFCAAPQMNGRRVRRHSLDYLRTLIADVVAQGVTHLAFVDDMLTADAKWATTLCRMIATDFPQVTCSAPNGIRLETVTEPLADAMAQAGWTEVVIAPESGSAAHLARMDKHLDLRRVPVAVDRLKGAGLQVHAFLLLAFPGETEADLALTYEMVMRERFDRISLHIFQPLPGTPVYDRLVAEGKIPADFMPSGYDTLSYCPETLTPPVLAKWYRRIYDDFERKGGVSQVGERPLVPLAEAHA